MRARHRHFNPKAAGADLVLDARYINQSDNTAVSTWADRSGNAYNASQATGASQPTFRTARQGGNGGLDFDGSNDFMLASHNPTAYPRSFHAVFVGDGGALGDANYSGVLYQAPQRANTHGWMARWGNFAATNTFVSGDMFAVNTVFTPQDPNILNPVIGSWSNDSSRTPSFFRDGKSRSVTGTPNAFNTPTTNGTRIGGLNNSDNTASEWFNGRIFSLHAWDGEQIAAPLRKRCEHASAFSFKISCN
jgi:hypothetical protein